MTPKEIPLILPSPASYRVIGFDLARALAVMGMVVVNFTSMLEVSHFSPDWLEPVVDFLYGRAAAVFVMLAGVSISLMARRQTDPANLRVFRKRLMKRSFLLMIAGMALWLWWPADILHFYAVFIAVGALAVTWSHERLRRWTAVVLLISMPVCAALTVAYDINDAFAWGGSRFNATWLLLDYFTSPYYSVFPWLGFFLAGMLLGRHEPADASFWRRACLIGIVGCLAVELFSGASMTWARHHQWDLEGLWWGAFLRSDAFPATPLFVLSSACSGLALIALCRVITFEARRTFFGLNALAACGRLSLTLYIAHIAGGILFRRWFANANADIGSQQMFLAAAAFGAFSIFFALKWFRHFQRGPLEALFHRLTHGRGRTFKRINSGPGAAAIGVPSCRRTRTGCI
jgi:uncharacterized protein